MPGTNFSRRARAARARWEIASFSSGAISVGIVDGEVLLDLPYAEDSRAEVDMNVVMTGDGELIEVQATAEKTPFGRASLDTMLELSAGGIGEIVRETERVLAGPA